MPYWFALFIVLWTPFLCILCFFTGASIMWAKQHNANPLTELKSLMRQGDYDYSPSEDKSQGYYV